MDEPEDDCVDPCCGEGPRSCVFAKALLARAAQCGLARREAVGERLGVVCGSPHAQRDCARLADRLRERARFALRLPTAARPLLHQQALRLQCGGLAAFALHVGRPVGDPAAPEPGDSDLAGDVHRLVQAACAHDDDPAGLPWADIVAEVAQWEPRRRRARP